VQSLGNRMYKCEFDTGPAVGYVCGGHRPLMGFWFWVVFCSGTSASGFAHSFKRAVVECEVKILILNGQLAHEDCKKTNSVEVQHHSVE
jgi:hypothetical protein